MTLFRSRRLAIAGITVAAALGAAGSAQASSEGDRCAARYDRLEERFRSIEEKRGWDEAADWWQDAWQRYYQRCEI